MEAEVVLEYIEQNTHGRCERANSVFVLFFTTLAKFSCEGSRAVE